MSLPNDEFRDIFSNKNKMPEYTTEGITSEDIRAKLNFADRNIKDDIDDYVFLKPTKKRRKGSKKSKSDFPDKKKKKSVKKILLIILIVILCIILAVLGTGIFLINQGGKQLLET